VPGGPPICLIADIVTVHRVTLVTGNACHFARVPELTVEDWLR